jgi:hypothetical protein
MIQSGSWADLTVGPAVLKVLLMSQPRKPRSDMTVGTFEKKNDLPPGTVRNPDGRDTRSDKQIGTIREQAEKNKPDKK